MRASRLRPAAWVLAVLLISLRASAALPAAGLDGGDRTEESPGVAFGADEVRLDTRLQSLDVTGNVRVDEPPFHLRSDELLLKRVPIGAELTGEGKLAFCPCLGTPLAVRFSGATVAPPYDVILKGPILEVFGIPVFWAPAVWLRSPARPGILPPDLAWRGADGFFAGGGVHLLWLPGDTVNGLDLRAGGYVKGGVAIEATIAAPSTRTTLGWDRLRGDDGFSAEAYGATSRASAALAGGDTAESVAWQVAALRGARAVHAATDANEAAKPFDRALTEAVWRAGGFTLASRVESVALRGSSLADFGVTAPVVIVRRSDALGAFGTADATLEGGSVTGAGTTTFARADVTARWALGFGPMVGAIAMHGLGDLAEGLGQHGADGAAEARTNLGIPLVRAFDSAALADPWVHTTEPHVEAAAIAVHAGDALFLSPRDALAAPNGGAWVAAAGWWNALGQVGTRSSAEVDANAGLVGDEREARFALRARGAASIPGLSLRGDFARVVSSASRGGAFVAEGRLGPRNGLHIEAHVAQRDGVDPLLARALVDPKLEPGSGFFSASGWTGGTRIGLPLGSRVSVRGGAEMDFRARTLVAAAGAIELHDPCNCVVVRANGSERIGRGGVDIWVSVDLPMAPR